MRAWLPFVALALLAVLPAVAATPLVPDVIQGGGTVSTFQIMAFGYALQGGAYENTRICAECFILFTTTSTGFFVVDLDSGPARALSPGVYELREFRGLYAFSAQPEGGFYASVHGVGRVIQR